MTDALTLGDVLALVGAATFVDDDAMRTLAVRDPIAHAAALMEPVQRRREAMRLVVAGGTVADRRRKRG